MRGIQLECENRQATLVCKPDAFKKLRNAVESEAGELQDESIDQPICSIVIHNADELPTPSGAGGGMLLPIIAVVLLGVIPWGLGMAYAVQRLIRLFSN